MSESGRDIKVIENTRAAYMIAYDYISCEQVSQRWPEMRPAKPRPGIPPGL